MSDNSGSDIGAFLAGFVIGGLVGAATAIILAPQSGAETRSQIASKRDELVRSGSDQYHHARESAAAYSQEYKERAGEAFAGTRHQVSSLQERIVLTKGKTKETTEEGANEADSSPADEGSGDAGSNNGEG